MSNVLKLISPICPSVNHYLGWRAIMKKGKNGKMIPMAMSYETAEAKKYKKDFSEYVKEQVKLQEYDLEPNKYQHFYVDCDFYFERTDCDANNYFKLLLDTITETQLIWLDDNVTCERVNKVLYDSKNPRIEISIYPVDYIGIFENISQLEEFESKCVGCSRYKRNCSLLNKAKEGWIQDEINDLECIKYKKAKEKNK